MGGSQHSDHIGDMVHLRSRLFEEFPPRRRVVEQIRDIDDGAHFAGRWRESRLLAAFNSNRPGRVARRGARRQLNASDSGDAGQRFSTKSHRSHA